MSEVTIAHWEVTRAKNAGQKPNPHGGQLDKWYVGLKNLDGGADCEDAYWQRKNPSEVTVGDKVFGKVEDGDYGFRFWLEKDEGGSSGGSESQAGTTAPRGGRDLDASIARQVALKVVSARICKEGLNTEVRAEVEGIEKFILEAGQTANQGAGAASQQGASPPEGSQGAHTASAPDSQPAVDLQELGEALDTAGLVYAPAREKVALYMSTELSEADRTRALKQLTDASDTETQGMTLRAMQQRTESWTGKPLPEDASTFDDDIPFRRPEYRALFTERERWRF